MAIAHSKPALFAWKTGNEFNNNFPQLPGVYVIYVDGEVGYIGQSICLSSRLSSYHIHVNLFENEWVTPWGGFKRVHIKYKVGRRFGDWLMREARLIRRLRPRLNNYGVKSARIDRFTGVR